MTAHRPDRLSERALAESAARFRDWTRTEDGARICAGVAEGSLHAEEVLLAAFVYSVHPEDLPKFPTRAAREFSDAFRREQNDG